MMTQQKTHVFVAESSTDQEGQYDQEVKNTETNLN